MSICIKEEPTFDSPLPLVSIPVHEPDSENLPPQSGPVSRCTLCIRECSENSESFESNSGNPSDLHDSLSKLFGREFRQQSFNVCKTCWKMVRMIDDFRKCCLKAQRRIEHVDSSGLAIVDDWNSEEMGQTIDFLQEMIANHTKRIELARPAEEELVTELCFDQIKVEPYEAEEVDQKDQPLATGTDYSEKMFGHVTPSDDLLMQVSSEKFEILNKNKLTNRKPEEKKYHCQLCDLAFTRIGHLRVHKQRMIHQQRVKLLYKLKTAKSSDSDYNTELIVPDDELLVVKSVEKVNSKKPETNPYKCETCDVKFNSGHNLRMHQTTIKHQQAVKFYSEDVDVKMAEHINNLQNETYEEDDNERKEISQRPSTKLKDKGKSSMTRNHKCPICAAKMASKHSLRIHLNFVHSEARFECDHCGRKFKTKNALKGHLFMQHVASRDFVCPVCSKGFVEAGALQGHLTSHKGYRPFECNRCEKGYHTKKQLDRHVKKCH